MHYVLSTIHFLERIYRILQICEIHIITLKNIDIFNMFNGILLLY